MDKTYQDIHFISKTGEEEVTRRLVKIKNIEFNPTTIRIEFSNEREREVMYLPKLSGYSLLID